MFIVRRQDTPKWGCTYTLHDKTWWLLCWLSKVPSYSSSLHISSIIVPYHLKNILLTYFCCKMNDRTLVCHAYLFFNENYSVLSISFTIQHVMKIYPFEHIFIVFQRCVCKSVEDVNPGCLTVIYSSSLCLQNFNNYYIKVIHE